MHAYKLSTDLYVQKKKTISGRMEGKNSGYRVVLVVYSWILLIGGCVLLIR